MQFLLKIDTHAITSTERKDIQQRVTEILRNRIDQFGVQEPLITKQGVDGIMVQLPGLTDRRRAMDIITKTAHLEFKLVSDDLKLLARAEKGAIPKDYEYLPDNTTTNRLLLEKKALLGGDHLKDIFVGFDNYGTALVHLQFDPIGARMFENITTHNVHRQLAIVLDGKIHSAPVINEPISASKAQISGNFTTEEAQDLALVLRAGSLPAPVKIIEERTIGPTLGQDSIRQGLRAIIAGGILVFLFMPAYFFIAGLIADIGLMVYALSVIGLLAFFQAALTLPGIAGFILSIGMAVDANILITERIREEIDTGKKTYSAVQAGYSRAFSAILDSNITTLISSVLLYYFGTGPVKGFAVTLSIGVLASMFSALFVTRIIFDYLTQHNPRFPLKMVRLFAKPTHIHFLGYRKWAYLFSLLTLMVGLFGIFGRGYQNFGLDFKGGTLVQVGFSQPIATEIFRKQLQQQGLKDFTLQPYGDTGLNRFIIKTADNSITPIENASRYFADAKKYQILKVDRVGPSASEDLRQKAITAILLSFVGILIYLGWRFKWPFALAAVIALLHDILFTIGLYALSGRDINLATVAAILTIMGYSVNDTIITFDRMRDNLKKMPKAPFQEVLELSINQTLGRTILTSTTTILTVIAIFFFGGQAINDFAFTLLVGFCVGIYSTIFVATSLVTDWKIYRNKPQNNQSLNHHQLDKMRRTS
jgi:SecD/SecF fusion protein